MDIPTSKRIEIHAPEGLRCAFCGKTKHEVKYLIAAREGPAICDECLVGSMLLIASQMEVPPSQVISQLRLHYAEARKRIKEQT